MRKKGIASRIISGYSALVAVIFSLLLISYFLESSTVNRAEQMYDDTEEIRLQLEAKSLFGQQAVAMINFFPLGDDRCVAEFNKHKAKFLEAIEKTKPSLGKVDRANLEPLERQYGVFVTTFDKSVSFYKNGQIEIASTIERDELDLLEHQIEESLDRMISAEQSQIEASIGAIRTKNKYAILFPTLSIAIAHSEELYKQSQGLTNSLQGESYFWKQVIALSKLVSLGGAEHIGEFQRHGDSFKKLLNREIVLAETPEETDLLNKIDLSHKIFSETFIQAAMTSEKDNVVRVLRAEQDDINAEHDLENLLGQFYPLKQRDMAEALANIRVMTQTTLSINRSFALYLIVLLGFGSILIVAYVLRITRPVGELMNATQQLAAGDFNVRAEVRTKDEIGELAQCFNEMANRLQQDRTIELERINQSLRSEITERKRIEIELESSRDKALESTRLKSEFLANVSHEIRTPMNGIIGMTEITLDTDLSPDQREYLGMVKQSADALLIVIDDVLDFSKIEAGRLNLNLTSFSLRESIGDSVKALGILSDSKELGLSYHIQSDVPDLIVGDPDRLRQVLTNLIGNAIKFTERGVISVHVKPESQTDSEVVLLFLVADTGIGIAEDKKEQIFEAFIQADGSHTRRYGGTGLGLAISSRLVNLMGGRIWVESQVDRGSTFYFTTRFGLEEAVHVEASDLVPDRLLAELALA